MVVYTPTSDPVWAEAVIRTVVLEGYDPAARWAREAAPENVLPGPADSELRFDAAFIDGNRGPADGESH